MKITCLRIGNTITALVHGKVDRLKQMDEDSKAKMIEILEDSFDSFFKDEE